MPFDLHNKCLLILDISSHEKTYFAGKRWEADDTSVRVIASGEYWHLTSSKSRKVFIRQIKPVEFEHKATAIWALWTFFSLHPSPLTRTSRIEGPWILMNQDSNTFLNNWPKIWDLRLNAITRHTCVVWGEIILCRHEVIPGPRLVNPKEVTFSFYV